MIRRFVILFLSAVLVVIMSGCGTGAEQTASSTATSTVVHVPTATPVPVPPTPTNVPAGWQVYFGTHFTIAYPANWTMMPSPHQQGLQGGGVTLSNQDNTGLVSVVESYGYSQSELQALCQLDGTPKILAGIQMKYVVGEGVHRNWSFVNSNGIEYSLDALDATQPQDVQAVDDSILATFRPDDATPLCSH